MTRKQIGRLGEQIACNFLRKKGYQILDRNFLFKIPKNPQFGEIDIVAKRGNVFHFVEVKTLIDSGRELDSAISPEQKVDFKKKRKILKTVELWLLNKKIPFETPWQIDIISVKIDLNSKKAKVSHFKNV
jgi:putative endonuclease